MILSRAAASASPAATPDLVLRTSGLRHTSGLFLFSLHASAYHPVRCEPVLMCSLTT